MGRVGEIDTASGADIEEEVDDNFVFDSAEVMPEFPGGQIALMQWIRDNMNYPIIARENGIQGRVDCSLVVNADGSVADVVVDRGVDPSIDKEAVRVLRKLPDFTPGMQKGKPVRVKYSVQVSFKLQ